MTPASSSTTVPQPYKPDTFVNGPRFLPDTMMLEQADACDDGEIIVELTGLRGGLQ